MALKFIAGKGNTFYDMSDLAVKTVISGRKGAAPRTLSITLVDAEGHDRPKIDSSDGWICTFYDYDGKTELFRGLVMTDDSSNKRQMVVKAYDNCIYLSNNKDSFSFKKKRADEIFLECMERLKLPIGTVDNTGHVIGELAQPRTTFWDVIEEALSQTYAATGRRYYVSSSKGKISLKRRRKQQEIPILSVGTNIETYSRTRSIYNTRTRLKLVTSKDSLKESYVNTALERKIGMFQDIESVEEGITAAELKQRIDTFKEEKSLVEKSLKVSGPGISSVIAGACVYVKIPQSGVGRYMYVDEDTHTYTNNYHEMTLKLNYARDIDLAG